MERAKFNWLAEDPPERERKLEPAREPREPRELRKKLAKFALPAAIFVFIVCLFAWRLLSKPEAMMAATEEVLVPLFPIGKGQEIDPDLLQLMSVKSKDLSRSQHFQLVKEIDLIKLRGKIVAKKSIGPASPVLWSDLEVKAANLKVTRPAVIYPPGVKP